MTRLLVIGFLCILALGSTIASARLVRMPGYAKMSEESDLIVIATPVDRKELAERTTVPNVGIGDGSGKVRPIPAIQVEVTFSVMAVFKGRPDENGKTGDNKGQLTLLHLKLADPKDGVGRSPVQLVDFTPGDGSQYLMFLKHRADGRYEPVNGQADPVYAIEKLQQRLVTQPVPAARP